MFALPTELQLHILSQTHCPGGVSRHLDTLSQHIHIRKLAHYTLKPLTVSIYSTSSKDLHKKLFYEASVSNDSKRTVIKLEKLQRKHSLIEIKNLKDPYTHKSHLDLLVDEEQTSTKLFVAIMCEDEVLIETTLRLQLGAKSAQKHGLHLQFDMVKGEKENKDGLYEYQESYNYALNLSKIELKNEDMVKLFEKDGYMFVRC